MKTVLSIGQCGPDHASIFAAIRRGFGAEVVGVDTLPEAERHLAQSGPPSLILVNRKLDVDYSDGLEVIRSLRASPPPADVPVMLVSNYPEYQAQAVALGAVSGFGKNELGSADFVEKLRPYLG